MPHYKQLTSACGLTAVLQAIQPNQDPFTLSLLENVAKRCSSSFPALEDMLKDDESTRHQVVTAYILLRAARSDEISSLLKDYDADNYEFTRDIITYELERRMVGKSAMFNENLDKYLKSYFKKGNIDRAFLAEYTTRVKTDAELKLLMALFGYKFVRFPYSADGTGAINFALIENMIDLNIIQDESANNYDDIFEFMLTFMELHFEKGVILINTGFHWVTAQRLILEDDKRVPELFYLDPSTGSKPSKLTDFKSNIWFYIFQFDQDLRDRISDPVKRILNVKF